MTGFVSSLSDLHTFDFNDNIKVHSSLYCLYLENTSNNISSFNVLNDTQLVDVYHKDHNSKNSRRRYRINDSSNNEDLNIKQRILTWNQSDLDVFVR